ncbi:MAG: hypothetical protein AB1Z98_04835 [Nannocystaceae bacterium]
MRSLLPIEASLPLSEGSVVPAMGTDLAPSIDGRTLTTLDLTGTTLSPQRWRQLLQIIRSGGLPSLRSLVLARTNLDRGVLRELIIALRRGPCPELEVLDLRRTVGINVGALALTLERSCPRLQQINGVDIGPVLVLDGTIKGHINRINSVLNYGILNARQAFTMGLVVTLSSDRLTEGGQDFTDRMYVMSTYSGISIELAVRGSLSIAMERQDNGVRVRQEIPEQTRKKIQELPERHRATMLRAAQANAPWIVDQRDLPVLEQRAQCSALFVSSSDLIADARALVDDSWRPIANPRALLQISKDRKNEISLRNANILPSVIVMVLVPSRLRRFTRFIGRFDDATPFGGVVSCDDEQMTLNYVFSPNPGSAMEPLRSAPVRIRAPQYFCPALIRFAKNNSYTITHVARCD